MKTTRSKKLFAEARKVIPGGVNSPVRAFGSVGGNPLVIDSAKGARVTDVDGNSYIDYVGSWGPMIVGHAHPKVLKAAREALAKGASFGAPTKLETDLAQLICSALPSVDRVRMVSSGTEATMSAIRLARGVTSRNRILKFDGGYHGHSDGLLVGAGSGVATLGIPGSPGVPPEYTSLTIQAPYNDLLAVKNAFRRWGKDIAAIIVEPVAGNMGCIPPQPGFLKGLREVCDKNGSLLIFDEVMSGFRVAWGGAQRKYRIRPDLTCLGKVVGGGMPAAAYGGRAKWMKQLAPDGPVYQAGTLSGNPLAMAAGAATLRLLEKEGVYEQLEERATALMEGFEALAADAGIPLYTVVVGGMFGFFFQEGPVHCYADAQKSDLKRFNAFFAAMLEEGIYMAPSAFETGFVSLAHGKREISATLVAAKKAFAKAANVR
ncbi:MAG: glutamate-1-semialdehyde 2,1-aminomutase [Deltaproteobacteria bacterium]|nr:glutamate-1-semialdehyde 2,1-aminomutase [Deltaproteobacteria bacterium]